MKSSRTNLEYLMSLCNVRGVEIARRLHIDQSLVGKWKNGTRSLSPASSYIDGLAELFCEYGGGKPEALFKEIYKERYKPEQLADFIKAFLCSTDPGFMAQTALHKDLDADSSSLYYSYDGLSGRKKAMDYLLNCAANAGSAVTIYLYDSKCFDWLISDPDYLKSFGRRIIELLACGSDVYMIIDSETDKLRAAALLSNMYLFSVYKHFNVYYADGANYPTVYIVGGMLAAVGYNDFREDSFLTQVFTDHSAVRQQELYMRRLLKKRQKGSIRRYKPDECFFNVKNLSVIKNDIYMFSPVPTIFSMPEYLLDKVLSYNEGFDENMTARIKGYNALTFGEFFSEQAKVKCLFSLKAILQALENEYVLYSDNMHYAAPLYVKAEDFQEHLSYIVSMMKRYENYSVGILPEIEMFDASFSKLGYMACKKNCWAMMSNEHSGQKALFFMNSSLVELIFIAQEYTWENIPEAYTNRENVIKIISSAASKGEDI